MDRSRHWGRQARISAFWGGAVVAEPDMARNPAWQSRNEAGRTDRKMGCLFIFMSLMFLSAELPLGLTVVISPEGTAADSAVPSGLGRFGHDPYVEPLGYSGHPSRIMSLRSWWH